MAMLPVASLDNYHNVRIIVKLDNNTFKIDQLPTFTIDITMVNVKGEWNLNTRDDFIIDAEIGPRISTRFKHLHKHEMIYRVREWLRRSDVQLDARTQVQDSIESMLVKSKIVCRFLMHCFLKYDIYDIMDENKSKASEKEEKETCTICLENYNIGEDLNKMQHCNHHFHNCCITNWMKKSNLCPLCREPIISYMY
ncbi:uncharacterized protein LOC124935734 [Impatiens glandulifera]|uniref:uncharacterized protein LOC124935734 n=1 Tax=Impatiens glandulifera TaxID=253017 RepID=UPI001FB17F21|nr:uncharacterized protein LOC124935734 [Impatiens glandulifera]